MDELLDRLGQIPGLAKIVGCAPAFTKVLAQLPIVAVSDATVLITGETGTGKEVVARALHYLSKRAAFPFVAVNCGCFPPALLEDELFGHERGAFTDAHVRRQGLIAQAEKGTLFLDEVDSLSPGAQAAFLRVLQDKRYRPVGSSVEQQADIRILAATNARLDQLVRSSAFRTDLYYRFSVFTLSLPPLRERQADILPLAEYFLRKHGSAERVALRLGNSALEALMSHDWPGNVRELENALIRGIHYSRGDQIAVGDLGLESASGTEATAREPNSFKAAKQDVVENFERRYLSRLMAEHNGNVSQAARAAGKERRDLGKLLKKYQLDPKLFGRRAG